jgi:hypothetical protein
MRWPSQRTRVLIYWSVPFPLFVSLFLLGPYRWIAFVAVAVLLFAALLEMCPRCGGSLLVRGMARRDETGAFICCRCATGRDGLFG